MTPSEWTAYWAVNLHLSPDEFRALVAANPYIFFTPPIFTELMVAILVKHRWKTALAFPNSYLQEPCSEKNSRYSKAYLQQHPSVAEFINAGSKPAFVSVTVWGDDSGSKVRWEYYPWSQIRFSRTAISECMGTVQKQTGYASPLDMLAAFDEAIRTYRCF
jgi:hypothetical protein